MSSKSCSTCSLLRTHFAQVLKKGESDVKFGLLNAPSSVPEFQSPLGCSKCLRLFGFNVVKDADGEIHIVYSDYDLYFREKRTKVEYPYPAITSNAFVEPLDPVYPSHILLPHPALLTLFAPFIPVRGAISGIKVRLGTVNVFEPVSQTLWKHDTLYDHPDLSEKEHPTPNVARHYTATNVTHPVASPITNLLCIILGGATKVTLQHGHPAAYTTDDTAVVQGIHALAYKLYGFDQKAYEHESSYMFLDGLPAVTVEADENRKCHLVFHVDGNAVDTTMNNPTVIKPIPLSKKINNKFIDMMWFYHNLALLKSPRQDFLGKTDTTPLHVLPYVKAEWKGNAPWTGSAGPSEKGSTTSTSSGEGTTASTSLLTTCGASLYLAFSHSLEDGATPEVKKAFEAYHGLITWLFNFCLLLNQPDGEDQTRCISRINPRNVLIKKKPALWDEKPPFSLCYMAVKNIAMKTPHQIFNDFVKQANLELVYRNLMAYVTPQPKQEHPYYEDSKSYKTPQLADVCALASTVRKTVSRLRPLAAEACRPCESEFTGCRTLAGYAGAGSGSVPEKYFESIKQDNPKSHITYKSHVFTQMATSDVENEYLLPIKKACGISKPGVLHTDDNKGRVAKFGHNIAASPMLGWVATSVISPGDTLVLKDSARYRPAIGAIRYTHPEGNEIRTFEFSGIEPREELPNVDPAGGRAIMQSV